MYIHIYVYVYVCVYIHTKQQNNHQVCQIIIISEVSFALMMMANLSVTTTGKQSSLTDPHYPGFWLLSFGSSVSVFIVRGRVFTCVEKQTHELHL